MPRNGDGSSDNGPMAEDTHTLAHGTGNEQTSHVPRADKTAPLPEHEHGQALEGMNASGGQSQGIKHGDTVGQGKGVDLNKSNKS
jgi:hypothetical protein